MAKIISIRAEITEVMPPPYAYNAEIQIEENGKRLFIHINIHTDSYYTVAEKSIYDYMANKTDDFEDVEFIEEYENIEETKDSKYAKYFQIADKIIDNLIDD